MGDSLPSILAADGDSLRVLETCSDAKHAVETEFTATSKERNKTFPRRLLFIRPPVLSPLTRRIADILIFLSIAALAISVWQRPDLINLGGWGYAGAFFVNAISTATILLPAPGIAAILVVADQYDPTLLGIATGLGGAVGSLTAYWAGVQGQRIVKEEGRIHKFLAAMMARFGGLVLFLFSFLFFMPADIASIVAGVTKYPKSKYFLYVGVGHVSKMIIVFWVFQWYFA